MSSGCGGSHLPFLLIFFLGSLALPSSLEWVRSAGGVVRWGLYSAAFVHFPIRPTGLSCPPPVVSSSSLGLVGTYYRCRFSFPPLRRRLLVPVSLRVPMVPVWCLDVGPTALRSAASLSLFGPVPLDEFPHFLGLHSDLIFRDSFPVLSAGGVVACKRLESGQVGVVVVCKGRLRIQEIGPWSLAFTAHKS